MKFCKKRSIGGLPLLDACLIAAARSGLNHRSAYLVKIALRYHDCRLKTAVPSHRENDAFAIDLLILPVHVHFETCGVSTAP